MGIGDLIGKRGEAIVVERLMDFCGNPTSYFDPHALGEKCPTFDFLVELVNAGDRVPYFFAQVKATRKPLTKRASCLAVQVDAVDVRRMVRCPVPAYLIGVDEPTATAYVVSVHGTLTGAIASMPLAYPLTAENLRKLWDEVRAFWHALDPPPRTSRFTF